MTWRYRRNLICTLLALGLLMPGGVLAEWVTVDDFSQMGGASQMLDNNQCQFRLRYIDNQHAGSGTFQDFHFAVTRVHQFRQNGEDGEVYSQTFQAPISRGVLGNLYFGGAITQSKYNDLNALFVSPKNPWDLKISFIRGEGHRQLSLSYYFFNESAGANYSSTSRITEDYFRLQADCGSSGGTEQAEAVLLGNVTASASSSYASSYGPEKTLDGNQSSYWIGASGEGVYYLMLELDSEATLDRVEIDWYSSTYASNNFDVEISQDGVNFSLIASGLNGASSADLQDSKAKFVRISMNAVSASFPVVRELRLHGWEE